MNQVLSMTSISDGLNSSSSRFAQLQDLESVTAMMRYLYTTRMEGT